MSTDIRTPWLTRDDIAFPVPGKDDPKELIERCWAYLKRRQAFSPQAPDLNKAVRAALLAAVPRQHPEVRSLAKQLARQQETSDRQEATIDRLLAMLQPRAQPIAHERLAEISAEVRNKAQEVFSEHCRRIQISVTDESDADFESRHCLMVEVLPNETAKTNQLFKSESALHQFLVERLSSYELKAVVLMVQYMDD